jgi:hypothetical protein
MGVKAKTFDCVEWKHRAQDKLRAEYEARKAEFASYWDFLDAKAEESEFAREIKAKAQRQSG